MANINVKTQEENIREKELKARWFIRELIKLGVPRENVEIVTLRTSVFHPSVVVTRENPLNPKGNFGNYDLRRKYRTFNKRTLRYAKNFYFAKQRL